MWYLTSTLWPRRAISWPLGIRSFSITVGGRCHTALKLSSWIAELRIGVGRSGLPTTPACRDTMRSFSTASICAAGMLTTMYFLPAVLARSVRRVEVGLQLLQPRRRRHVERRDGALVDDAGRRQPVGGLVALHRLLDVEVEALRAAAAPAGRRTASRRWRSSATAGCDMPDCSWTSGSGCQPPRGRDLGVALDGGLHGAPGWRGSASDSPWAASPPIP